MGRKAPRQRRFLFPLPPEKDLKSPAMNVELYAKVIIALLFVLGLIGLLATAVRRWGLGVPQTGRKHRADKRLGLVEVMPLDAKRRLVLVRRDEVEHLLILGATSEVVVETGIPASREFAEVLADAQDTARNKKVAP